MQSLFLVCLAVGGIALALQIVLALVGVGEDALHLGQLDVGGSGVHDGLDLLSVRSLAAALAVFGAAGLWLNGWMPGWLAAGAATLPAFLAAAGTAYLMRVMIGMESDGSLRLEEAVGATGQVYLTIPPEQGGTGLVHFPLQGRSVEIRAVTREKDALPTGASVLVISVDAETETVEVVATSNVEGLLP
jgi:hypothetical protein